MAQASAYLKERDYVLPSDVQSVFADVCVHRLRTSSRARISRISAASVAQEILKAVAAPSVRG